MGRDAANMVEAVTFLGIVLLACVTIIILGITSLLALMWWDLVGDLWKKVRRK